MIKRIYNSTLHIKNPTAPLPPPTLTVARAKAPLWPTTLQWKPPLVLPPLGFKAIADQGGKMDKSIQVESQSHRDPTYCLLMMAEPHGRDVAAGVNEMRPRFFTLAPR